MESEIEEIYASGNVLIDPIFKNYNMQKTYDEFAFEKALQKPSPDFLHPNGSHLNGSFIDIIYGAANANGYSAKFQWVVGAARTYRPLVSPNRLMGQLVTDFLSSKDFKPDELLKKLNQQQLQQPTKAFQFSIL